MAAVGEVFSSPPESSEALHAALITTLIYIQDLLTEFPDVLSSVGFTAAPPKHGLCHHLQTQPGPPVFSKSRHLDPEKLEIARLEFAAMEKAGIVRLPVLHGPVLSIWLGRRMEVGDLVVIIVGSIMTLFQIVIIADFTSCLDDSSVFSKLDLQNYQVPMSASDIQKPAIITPFGMLEFLRLSFGLRNAGQKFQRMMEQIFGDLPFCFVYVDDIFVFSKNISSHVSHLRDVFELCRQHGLPSVSLLFQRLNFLAIESLLRVVHLCPSTLMSSRIFQFPLINLVSRDFWVFSTFTEKS